jgi:hypothetical protein
LVKFVKSIRQFHNLLDFLRENNVLELQYSGRGAVW